MAFKKGDRVQVITHEFDFTPGGTVNDFYGFGATGTIDGFRNNRFHGRQAVVIPDSDTDCYVDWTLTEIEKI